MPTPVAKRVDRPAESRGPAAAPPARSDTPRTSGTRVASGNVAKSEGSVRSSTPVKSGNPVKSATSVQSSNPAKGGNPVKGGTSVKSNTPAGNFSETEKKAAEIVLRLKEEIKEYYKTKAQDEGPEVEYAGRFLHNIKVRFLGFESKTGPRAYCVY